MTKRVLVVEDHVDSANMLATFLRGCGFETSVAHDAPSALELARATRSQLAILDIGLPRIDGFALARLLRYELGAQLRLMAVSAFSEKSFRMRAREVGIEQYFVKPIPLDELEAAIRR